MDHSCFQTSRHNILTTVLKIVIVMHKNSLVSSFATEQPKWNDTVKYPTNISLCMYIFVTPKCVCSKFSDRLSNENKFSCHAWHRIFLILRVVSTECTKWTPVREFVSVGRSVGLSVLLRDRHSGSPSHLRKYRIMIFDISVYPEVFGGI
jgi:hypothetical protein